MMKKLILTVSLGLALARPAFAQEAPQPCTRTGSDALDTARCELVVAGQALAQANAGLVQLTARNAVLTNDITAA